MKMVTQSKGVNGFVSIMPTLLRFMGIIMARPDDTNGCMNDTFSDRKLVVVISPKAISIFCENINNFFSQILCICYP